MLPKYLNFLEKPSEQEFFTRFSAIYSRDNNGNAVAIELESNRLFNKLINKLRKDELFFCDKILIGETLETAITRSLRSELGLELVDYYLSVFDRDVIKNKKGIPVTRFSVFTYVDYVKLKNIVIAGYKVKWIERLDALKWLRETYLTTFGKSSSIKKDGILSFVKDLYTAGAIDINIYELYREEEATIDNPLKPDYLDIRLPKNKSMRKTIFSIFNKGILNLTSTRKEEVDSDQKTIQYYWN